MAYYGCIEIGEPVNLRSAKKTQFYEVGLEPVSEDLRHRHNAYSGVGKFTVTDRHWPGQRLCINRARFINQREIGRADSPCKVGRKRAKSMAVIRASDRSL